MSFNLKVTFVGLCHFIENSRTKKKVKLCVVLPDARRVRDGVDGSAMEIHRGIIRIRPQQITGDDSLEDERIWLLRRERITLDVTPSGLVENSYSFYADAKRKLAKMEEFAPKFVDTDASIVANKDVSPAVVAQILIREGKLVADGAEATWVIPSTLRNGDEAISGDLVSRLSLKIANLTSASLLLRPFEAGTPRRIPIMAKDGSEAEVIIGNLCPHDPLEWDEPLDDQRDDRDFLWHYELLSQKMRDKISVHLGDLNTGPAPVPTVPRNGDTDGRGNNCYGALGKRRRIRAK